MFKIASIFRYFFYLQISKILSLNIFYFLSYNSLNMCYFTCKICKFQYQTSARARSLPYSCCIYSLDYLVVYLVLIWQLSNIAFILLLTDVYATIVMMMPIYILRGCQQYCSALLHPTQAFPHILILLTTMNNM